MFILGVEVLSATVTSSALVFGVTSANTSVTEPLPVGVAHVLSPLKNVVEEGVPVADKSIAPVVTAPVAPLLEIAALTNCPLTLVKEVTTPPAPPPPVEAIVNVLLPLSVKVMLDPA